MRVPACLCRVPCSSARRARSGSRSGQRIGPAIVRYKFAMRLLPLLACLLACAEWRLPPTFPAEAAGQPVIHEQALLALFATGDAAVAQLVDADGRPPELALLRFDRAGGPSRVELSAPANTATR